MKRALAIANLLVMTLAGVVVLLVLAIAAVLVLPTSCTAGRPSNEALLQRHLGLESTNGFSRVEIKYQPAREWTARFYLEATPERLERLLTKRHFVQNANYQTNEIIHRVAFAVAPPPPPVMSARFFFKAAVNEGVIYEAVVSTNGTQLWIRAQRF